MAAEQTDPNVPNSSSSSSASTPPSPSTSPTTAKLTHLRIQSQRPAPPPPSSHPLLSPLRTSFSQNMYSNSHGHRHARTRSVSTPYSHTPLSPSPLSSSFGFGPDAEPPKHAPAVPVQIQPSKSAPEAFSLQSNGTSVNGSAHPGAPLVSHSHPLTQINNLSFGAPPPRRRGSPKSHAHGHARIHSRNLSVFFPRPGASDPTATTIAEDGAQEVLVPFNHEGYNSSDYDDHAHRQGRDRAKQLEENRNDNGSSRTRHRPKQPLTPLGQGFTFGLKPPPAQSGAESTSSSHSSPGVGSNLSPPLPQNEQRTRTLSSSSAAGPRTRRGHHHKHSLSHNFFSFLEPGVTGLVHGARETGNSEKEEELHTQPAPVPVSQWSAFSHGHSHSHSPPNGHLDTHSHSSRSRSHSHLHTHSEHHHHPTKRTSILRQTASLIQLALGATLWVCSQQVGSIACTGIGYWVVFDAIGVFLGGYGEGRKGRQRTFDQERELERIRQPYGPARLSTVLIFAQAVYLMFSAVYVCKETVEHLLLSAGGPSEEGHHHHTGDEDGLGIDFPILITSLTFLSVFLTAYLFNNHSRILALTNNRIPPISTLLRRFISPSPSTSTATDRYPAPPAPPSPPPNSRLAHVFSNPFVTCPLLFSAAIGSVGLFVDESYHRLVDLVLATLLALATFRIAYQACVVLGSVLLQTAPPRGAPGGKMEAFLRVMRELERHPHVLHLPAPRLWQLTPPLAFSPEPFPSLLGDHDHSDKLPPPPMEKPPPPTLVATVQIHVPRDLPDEDVLALTKFAWERCMRALGDGSVPNKQGRGEDEDGDENGEENPEVTVGIVRG